ncbi:MAG: DUF2975 domain-containing protein [Bacteroidota bacterium]
MKIINWWIDRYSIGGLFIASILCAIMSLLMTCHIFFDFTLSDKLGNLSMEYKKGIAVPVKFHSSPGGDTSILFRAKRNKDTTFFKVVRPDLNGNWGWIQEDFDIPLLSTDSVFYRDTIFSVYRTVNTSPPWKDNWKSVSKLNFENGTAYIKPSSFYNRGLLLVPQVLFFMLLSYFCWQLAFFLDNIQRGQMFSFSNYARIRNLGISILIYQILLFIIYLLENSYRITIDYESTIPNYRTPIHMDAEPDYHLGWSYLITGCILLIIAKAFYKGHKLQQEQDLTV